ncbi:MAG: apolipoprotein N-acyltransferase [Betaproteobacteria bacterium]|jgi:apolipoprotein N-acyltransferase
MSLLYSFFLGLLTAGIANSSSAGWWQLFTIALFWRLLQKHHFHSASFQMKLAWCFGFGYFALGLWWIYISLHDVGGMPLWMSILGVSLLSGFLALFPTFAVWAGVRLNSNSYSALTWASIWTLVEWLRGHILTGFPWIGFGDTQLSGPFVGIIPIFGVLGATFLVFWGAFKIGSAPERLFFPLFSLGFAIFLISFLENISYTQPIGKPLEVRLIQGNFPQLMQYQQSALEEQNNFYLREYQSKSADLIIGPETAFSLPEDRLPVGWDKDLKASLKENQTYLITGMIGAVGDEYSNRARAYLPNGEIYAYDKSHLVPFGEYIPPGFMWFVRAIQAPMTHFVMGDLNQPHLKITRSNNPDVFAVITICYEDAFGSELASRMRESPNDANFLVNITNLAWFGNTSAPLQQLRLAQLRSLESGLPSVRATNTGITGFIDGKGKVQTQLPVFVQESLVGNLQPRQGKTPYIKWGDAPILLFCIAILAFRVRKNRTTVIDSY